MSQLLPNIGRAQAGVRLVLAVLWLVGVGWVLHHVDANWALTDVTFGGFILVYLLVTAALRIDPLVEMFDLRSWRSAARDAEVRRAPPRVARNRPQD